MTPHRIAISLLALGLVASSAGAKTLRTITIDGNLNDWTEVLLDRDHKVADRSAAQGDPDNPSQAQRDERGVAFTWDATNLYLYFSRTGAGTNSFNGIFYVDLNHDARLSAADRIAIFKFTGSSFNGFELDRYNDGGTPDALGGDGASPVGVLGTTVTTAGANAAVDSNGIAMECSMTWASLGVPSGTPLFIHPALSSNTNLPAGIQDNTDNLDTFLVGVLLSPGGTQGTAPGRSVDFPHLVTNDGTGADVIDVFFRTRLGFALEVWSDPNGDGDPTDGALLGRDANGDGDMTDSGDTPPSPVVDANRNGFVDGGSLAAGASRPYVLRVGVPPRQALGTEEVVTVFAASGYKPSVRVQTEDHVRVGLITLAPPLNLSGSRGVSLDLAHSACNDSGSPRTLDVSFSSLLGWSGVAWTDPDGDGDPADGAPLADSDGSGLVDLGVVADGACVPFVLVLDVPASAPIGIRDDVTVTLAGGPDSDQIVDFVRVVASVVEVQPNRTAKGQRGRTVYLTHEVLNAGPATDSFTMSTTNTLGSTIAVLDDPNDDGDPDGSAVITNTGAVPPSGGRFPIITRVRLPTTATHGQVETVRTRGTSDASGGSDDATGTITVYGMLTYSDALFARPATEFFGQCSTIYVLAYRAGGGPYRFAWFDPGGAMVRASGDLTAYSDGSLDDFYDGGMSPGLGVWTVKLQEKQGGSNYVDVGPSGTITFEMRDLVSAGARVALNDTGSDLYLIAGDALVAYADVVNPTGVDVVASAIEHVAFFDGNGNGQPDAGEDYVLMDGSVAPWSAGLVTSRTRGIDVYSGETIGDRFATQPVGYTRAGVWTLRTTWVASCGFLIASRNVTFTIGCSPPPTFGGIVSATDIDPCAHGGIALAWDPVVDWGLGGSGTYAIHRSTVPGFAPDPSTLLDFGVTGTSYVDLTAAPDTLYSYLVRAENSGNCSDGPNNFGLVDANFAHAEASDDDYGIIPVASFDASGPACVQAGGASVTFTDTSQGPPTQWSWDFDGDGLEDSAQQSPTWSFPSRGDWTVTLVASNPCGADAATMVVSVGDPPAAAIAASRAQTCTDEPVDLDGAASSAVAPQTLAAWSWDFDGDGIGDSSAATPGPVTFPMPGSYAVALTVTDSLGCTDTATVVVDVHAALQVLVSAPAVAQCTGDASVVATPSGGLAPFTFAWDVLADDGAGTGSARFAFGTTRTATVTVTDAAGCTATATSAPITINPQLALALDPVTIDPCTGDVTLVARGSGGDGAYAHAFTNLVDDGTGRGSARLAPGAYTEQVTLTDGAGCTATMSVDYVVPERLDGDFSTVVTYLGPGRFQADLTATSSSVAPPVTMTWDVGADGSIDGSGATISFPMGAQQIVPVELTLQDASGCTLVVRHDVSSAGCAVDTPVAGVRVVRDGGGIRLAWDASTHPCHDRYDVLYATTARPAAGGGSWPTDPAFTSVAAEDADGSDQDTQLSLADDRDGGDMYILLSDGGTDGTWGPVESYGR